MWTGSTNLGVRLFISVTSPRGLEALHDLDVEVKKSFDGVPVLHLLRLGGARIEDALKVGDPTRKFKLKRMVFRFTASFVSVEGAGNEKHYVLYTGYDESKYVR